MFDDYKQAHDEMLLDIRVSDVRDEISALQFKLSELEKPYRTRMEEAADYIKEVVLKQGKSVTLHDVYARYTKGRLSTAWKKVAVACKAPQDIIDKHTKQGNPSVRVSILEEN